MSTEFKLVFEGEPDLEIDKFDRSLQRGFSVINRVDGIYVTINSDRTEDERCQYLIDRELDRLFLLTSIRVRATMVRTRVASSVKLPYRIHGSLPDDIRPQNWNYELPIQLRLWSLAVDSTEVRTKLILLFQIIELACPKRSRCPDYTDSSKAPHPLTECKFVRDLVAHSGEVSSRQLRLYCEYLRLPGVMLDITDPQYYTIIASKVPLMEVQARKIIQSALKSNA